MPTLAELRSQLPELQGLTDDQAVDAVQQAFYPDFSRDEIARDLGVKIAPPPPAPAPERTLGGTIADTALSVGKGIIAVPEAAVGLADIATGGRTGKFLEENVGYRPAEAKRMLDEALSPAQKAANKKVMEAEGLWETVKAAVKNPSVAGLSLAESLPLMLGGGVVARGMIGVGPVAAGALGEGVVGAGSAAAQIRDQTQDRLLTNQQAALAGASGATTALFGLIGGKVAQSMGLKDIDTLLAGAASNPRAAKGVVRRVLEGFVSEGALEELPQSISEQVMQNMALDRPLDEGVNQAAVLGLMAGGIMGAGANVMSGGATDRPGPGDILAAPDVDTAIKTAEQAIPKPATPATPAAAPVATPEPVIPPNPVGDTLTGSSMADLLQRQTDLLQRQTDPLSREAQQPVTTLTGKTGADLLATQAADPLQGLARDNALAREDQRQEDRAGQVVDNLTRGAAEDAQSVRQWDARRQPADLPELDAAVQPGDVLQKNGAPWPEAGAKLHLKAVLKGQGQIIPVAGGGYIVRPKKKEQPDEKITDAPGRAGGAQPATGDQTPAAVRGNIPAAGQPGAGVQPPVRAEQGAATVPTGDVPGGGRPADAASNGAADQSGNDQAGSAQPAPATGVQRDGNLVGREPGLPASGNPGERVLPAAQQPGEGRVDARAPAVHLEAVGKLRERLSSGQGPYIDSIESNGKVIYFAKGIGSVDSKWQVSLDLTDAERKLARRAEGSIALAETTEERNAAKKELSDALISAARRAAGIEAPAPAPVPAPTGPAEAGQPPADRAAGAPGDQPAADAKPALNEAGDRWTRMPAAERSAVLDRTAAKDKAKARIVNQSWDDLADGWRRAIARSMGELQAAAPTVSRETPPASQEDSGVSERAQTENTSVRELALQEQRDAGWNTDWPFIPADLMAADFRDLIRNDPSMDAAEKERILSAGKKLGVVPANEAQSRDPESGQFVADDGRQAESVASPFTGKPDPRNSAPMQELDGFKVGDVVDVPSRTFGQSTIEILFTREMTGFGPMGNARLRREDGKTLDVLTSELKKTDGQQDKQNADKRYNALIEQWNDLSRRYKAADDAGKAIIQPAMDLLNKEIEEARGESLMGARRNIEAAGKVQQASEAERFKAMPIGSRMRPSEFTEDKGIFWEKTGADEWTGRGEWFKKGEKRSSVVMGERGGMVEMKPAKAKPAASANTIFTDDMAAAARARLKAKLGRLGSGIDPEMLQDGIVLAGYHVEKGARTFAAFARAMLDDMGEGIRPYLKQFYMAVKYDPRAGAVTKDMSSAAFVEEFDMDAIVAPATGADDGTAAARNLEGSGQGTLGGEPAGDVRTPDQPGQSGQGADGRGGSDGRGNGQPAASGPDVGAGMGAGADDVPVPGRRARQGQDAGNRGIPRAPRPAAGPGLFDDAGREAAPVAPNAEPAAAPQFKLEDFTIGDELELGEGGQKTKFKNNVAAIRLVRELEESGRRATPDEQAVLAKYVGWGALAPAFDADKSDWAKEHAELKELLSDDEFDAARRSTRYAHYTSREIIQDGVYAALRRFGFGGGRVLEAGAGVGNFIGLMPVEMRTAGRVTAIERELLAVGIARNLYPLQNVQQADFTSFKGDDAYFDAAIGNPPFAPDPQVDQSGRKHLTGLNLHSYFFAKSVDMLREGGILAQVVTNYFLDSSKSEKARRYIGERARLLGAIRLPNNAFSKNANTEVTTDLIFLQKLPDSEVGSLKAKKEAKAWLDVVPYNGVKVNAYFAANPDMMLGDFGPHGTMYGPNQPALIARPGQDTAALLREAVAKLPADVYRSIADIGSDSATDAAIVALNKPPVSEGGYFMEDGKLMQRLPDIAGEARGREITPDTQWTAKTKLGDGGFDKIRRLSEMRATVRSLLAAELGGKDTMVGLRAALNEQYDAYQKAHGYINDPGAARVFDDDPDFPLLLSLEDKYEPGIGLAKAKSLGIKPQKSRANKGAIFARRVVETRQQVRKVETPSDAINVSMAERGRLDSAYIGQLLGREPDEVLRELSSGDKPLLFLDPATDEYVLRDAYLSGNVRAKLQQALAANMSANARALEEVQPEDIGAHEISAKIGAPWIPTEVYEDFAKDLFGEETKASINYVKVNAGYAVYISRVNELANTNKWGTSAYTGTELLAALLNNRAIKVQYKDDDGKTITNVEQTDLANVKAQDIKDRFQDWLFADADRSEKLVRVYNDTNNNYVTRKYDGSWLTFPGKVPDMKKPGDGGISFRRHQRNAVARTVQDRTALYDHVVGAGKTFTAIASAMELRRTGLANKPMITVPNHLVKQWAADFYRLYPGANILTATKKDFTRENRRRFLAKIATGDWDAVIIAHSSFGFIRPAPEFEAEFNEARVVEIEQAIEQVREESDDNAAKRTVKQLEGMKERLENKIKKLRDKPMDDLLDFEQIGIDQLFVDEAHMFKNLMFTTKMQNVAGLGDPSGSQRAYDMYVKVNEVFEKNGRGQGVVFMTGTPVSNSLAEKYHMMRFLMPSQMDAMGFTSFDAWANTFASVETRWMQAPSGDGYKAQQRMDNFVNVHELLKLFDQVADTVTMDEIKRAYKEEKGKEFPIPPLKGGRRTPVSLDKSPTQIAYMEDIARRAKELEQKKGKPQKGEDNILVIMGDARKAAMDIRLVDMDATVREPGGRIDRAADEIFDRYEQWNHVKGTQLVFSDLGTPKKHAQAELKEYQELMARVDLATDEVRDRAALGDEQAQTIIDGAEDAMATIESMGPDWQDSVKAAMRGFSVYDDLKEALMEKGIPEKEIAFIHDYNTDEKKLDLYRRVNRGDIRVLMGSTPKLGAGTNVQERIVALHHLDVPWKPSDVEQREGRALRQGNVLFRHDDNPGGEPDFQVEILAYVTKDTLDMRMWQIQESKIKMINQLRTRQIDREIENAFEDMEMSAGEMQAAATGNMDILKEIQARNDIKKLEQKKRSFEAQKNDLIGRERRAAEAVKGLPAQIEQAQALADASQEYRQAVRDQQAAFKVNIDGKEYTEDGEAADYLRSLYDAKIYTRKVEKGGKTVREELSADEYAALRKTVSDLREAGKAEDDKELADAVFEMTSWEERAAPLDVTIDGKNYTNRNSMAEAFSDIRGDVAGFMWSYNGQTFNRKTNAANAVRGAVGDALADEVVREIGEVGPFKVSVEGQTVTGIKGKTQKLLEIVMSYRGLNISGEVYLGEDAAGNPQKAADAVIQWAGRAADNAGSDLDYLKRKLESSQKTLADLKKETPMTEWPGQADLEAARKKWQEVRDRLKKADDKAVDTPKFQQGEVGVDIPDEVQDRMIAAYNANITEKLPDGYYYREVGRDEMEMMFGDLEDMPSEVREALERGEPVIDAGTPNDSFQWAKSEAPTEADFIRDNVRPEEMGPVKVSSIDAMFSENMDESGASDAFKVLAESEGWDAPDRGTRYFEIDKPNDNPKSKEDYPYIRIGVRISDHSRTARGSRPNHAIDININMAPQQGRGNEFHGADDWESAVRKLRTARLDDDGELKFGERDASRFLQGLPAKGERRSAAMLQYEADAITDLWRRKPTVIAVDSWRSNGVPAAVRREAEERISRGGAAPRAVFADGRVYLFAEALDSKTMPESLYHEVLGHYGMWGHFGEELDRELEMVATLRQADMRRIFEQTGMDPNNAANRIRAAEEVVAYLAQTRPNLSVVQRIVAAIRNWLRENVPGFKGMEMSDAEIIQKYILPARQYVEGGPDPRGGRPQPATAFGQSGSGAISTGQAASFEGRVNGSASNSKTIPDLLVSEAFLSKGLSGLEAPAQRRVLDGMLRMGQNLKVARRVVELLPVSVVDILGGEQGAAKNLFSDKSMLQKLLSVERDGSIAAAIDVADSFMTAVADVAAEWPASSGGMPTGAQERTPASSANEGDLSMDVTHNKEYTGNRGTFDPASPNIMFQQAIDDGALNQPRDFFQMGKDVVREMGATPGKLHWWHKSVGTQYNLARKNPMYRRVFERVQDFLNDVSLYATEAADAAPNIMPKLESWRDILKTAMPAADAKAIQAPIFEGTLTWARDADGQPVKVMDLEEAAKALTTQDKAQEMLRRNLVDPKVLRMWQGLPIDQYEQAVNTRYQNAALRPGVVWTDAELKRMFKLNDKQIGLYREALASVKESITRLALSDMVRYAGDDVGAVREEVMGAKDILAGAETLRDQLLQLRDEQPERADVLEKTANKVMDKAERAQKLIAEGYFPLMRFGHYTVTVRGEDGAVKFFSMYENRFEAQRAAQKLSQDLPEGDFVTRGTMNEEAYKLFAGVTPETLELFGEMLGLEGDGTGAADKVFQSYLKLARDNRSSMKRLIHRKGTAGFSDDVGRVLAGFVYSNARQISRNLHQGEIDRAVRDINDPEAGGDKDAGELGQQASRLAEYIKNPVEEAQALRGLLFAQYLGGSIASAVVNMTQPFAVTMPWLSQYGGMKKAGAQMASALKVAWAKKTGDDALDAALKKAEDEGIVAPQEVHHLMAQAQGRGNLKAGDGTAVGDAMAAANNALSRLTLAWGKPFATAELFNRRVTFVAAYRTAVEQKIGNPYAFAERAIRETQFIYNKGNRPQWARGAFGATLFTFKTYSISYLELLERMWNAGEPGSEERAAGRRAVFFAMGMLLLLGGGGGLPFMEDVEDVVDGVAQRMGYNFSLQQKRREFFQEAFGKAFGGFLEKGVSGLPGAPIDVAGRLGLGNVLPGTGLLQKKDSYTSDVTEMIGPAGDLFTRVAKSANMAGEGRIIDAGLEVSPTAARNVAKSIDMAATGIYKDTRGYKVLDVDAYDALAKAIGFQPGAVATVQEGDRAAQLMVQRTRARESEIAAKWAKGFADNDDALKAEARAELQRWNEKNPETPIRIRIQDVLKRAQKMRQSRAERIASSAPREVREEARRLMGER